MTEPRFITKDDLIKEIKARDRTWCPAAQDHVRAISQMLVLTSSGWIKESTLIKNIEDAEFESYLFVGASYRDTPIQVFTLDDMEYYCLEPET